jgi:hypothetical protein
VLLSDATALSEAAVSDVPAVSDLPAAPQAARPMIMVSAKTIAIILFILRSPLIKY